MDSKKLKAFLTVKDLGSLTKAADALNYTQSGMTHMMNALEKELGVTLLRRGRNGVALTAAARRLLPQFEDFVSAADALDGALEQLLEPKTPGIRVGAYSSMAQHWLPEIIRRFRLQYPDADVSVQMGAIRDIYDQLKDGALDCAFVSYQEREITDALEWVPLHNDELVAILPEDYPVNGALFGVHGFEDKEFLMPSDGFELDIDPMFEANGVHPGIRFTNLDDPAIISMVEHGLGLSVLTELVMRGRKDRVLALPLTPPAYRELGIVLRAERLSQHLVSVFLADAKRAVMDFYKT